MIGLSWNFRTWLGWFGGGSSQEPDIYIEGCEQVPEWLAAGNPDFLAFRDELATHIRESSFPPSHNETQWSTDEWLRSVYYDAFGPDAPEGDPYPVPTEHWGGVRLTDYMLQAVDQDDEWSSDGAPAWLTARGLTYQDIDDSLRMPQREWRNSRPQPADYLDHLERLTKAGLRESRPGEPFHEPT